VLETYGVESNITMEIVNDAKALTSISSSQDKGGIGSVDDSLPDPDLKIILLGDSAVGKSKLIERYLMDEYNPRQVRIYANFRVPKEHCNGSCLCVIARSCPPML